MSFQNNKENVQQRSGGLKRRSEDSFEPNAKQIKLSKEESDNIFAMALSGNSKSTGTSMKVDYSKYKISKKTSPTSSQPNSSRSSTSVSPPSTSSSSNSVSSSSTSSIKSSGQVQSETAKVDENMVTRRNDRQKVFAGRRKQEVLAENSNRINIRNGIISSNINSAGPIAYQLLKPELIKLSLEDLNKTLYENQYLAKDADELFLEFIKKDFPKYANEENKKDLTWRQLLQKLSILKNQKENEKLEMLTKRIAKTHQQNDKGRKTIVIGFSETKTRRGPTKIVPIAPKVPTKVMETQKSDAETQKSAKPQPKPAPAPIRPSAPISRPTSSSTSKKPAKKAPLMAKVIKMLKR